MSASEATTYQRLRSHLATRRLSAAAEALTTVLDIARTEQLSTIDALERPLALEAEATERRCAARRGGAVVGFVQIIRMLPVGVSGRGERAARRIIMIARMMELVSVSIFAASDRQRQLTDRVG